MVDKRGANPAEVPTLRYDFQRRQLPSFSPEDGKRTAATYNRRAFCRNGHSAAFVRAGVPEKWISCEARIPPLSLSLSVSLSLSKRKSISQPERQSSQRELRLDPARDAIRADPERILAVLS